MRTLKTVIIFAFFGICFMHSTAKAFTDLSACLVAQDIGIFKFDSKTARMGSASGIVGLTGHFQDHADQICTGDYSNIDEVKGLPDEEAYEKIFTVEVQVTQHAGTDSDKWLLHEVEDGYRDGEMESLGRLTDGAILRKIDSNKVFWLGLGGGSFTWLNNNVVVKISYIDLQGMKQEPIEVVQAYLQKYPSTIPSTLILDKAHD